MLTIVLLSQISNFLSEWFQSTVDGVICSSHAQVTLGIPQGILFGNFNVFMYINGQYEIESLVAHERCHGKGLSTHNTTLSQLAKLLTQLESAPLLDFMYCRPTLTLPTYLHCKTEN